jgi:hypothetical protein
MRAPSSVPAERASQPLTPWKILSAVGLRHWFWLQMNRSLCGRLT